MATVAVLNTRQTLFRARANEYPRTLLLIGALILITPALHLSSGNDDIDGDPLPFLGGFETGLANIYWLATVVGAALFAVFRYRTHGVRLRGMAYTMAVALAVYVFVAITPGATWHWRYLGLIGLAAVVWALVIAERSPWLAIVASVFTAISVLSGTTDGALYRGMGLVTGYGAGQTELRDVLLPALVALVGGAVGLLPRKPVDDERALVLLNDLTRLSRPADARRYAPPLLVLGALILAAVPLYQPVVPDLTHRQDRGWNPEVVEGFGGLQGWWAHPLLVDLYWLAAIVVAIGFAAWWYRVRAARQGVELRTRGLLVAPGSVLLGVLVGVPMVYSAVGDYFVDPYLHAWLLVISTVVAAAALGWTAVRDRRPAHRITGLVAGWLVASFAAAMLAIYLQYWALLVIAAAVLAMAWAERSRWLGLVAAAFTTAVVLTSTTDNSLFRLAGWTTDGHPQLDVLQDLLLPSAVLVIGGLAGLAVRRVR